MAKLDFTDFFDQLEWERANPGIPYQQWNADRKELLRPVEWSGLYNPDELLRPAMPPPLPSAPRNRWTRLKTWYYTVCDYLLGRRARR